MKELINFAHRGAAGHCPENTMVSFRRALELGATGIETDVQMTKDGELVLIHDESLKRTTGREAWINDVTLEEVRELDAGAWYGAEFAGERIPRLDELLELLKDRSTILNIELKNGMVQYPELEAKVIQAVRRYEMSERVVISSFNHYSLAVCKQIAPEIRTGLLYGEGLYEPWKYAHTVNADALHPWYGAVLPEWVAAAAEEGIAYHPFTVNEPQLMQKMIDAGVAGIITDYPDRLAELLSPKRV
ncbi:hypothetical protein DCC85_02340 [Paenibacillus sp. CAA11]|uniref:glycerophosphodiester phosphodiesterase n=1 Tax=Paenibacillus sp. CAA11 TaxID=1532905 RepID=UPI000D348713|nr:glycerophosphodiester phosphodiesterase [Paenibacillus sp. CAA11]AWB43186.1 hypothetical protein DCC85_02340 [Paenibacillus sp. CAA11]